MLLQISIFLSFFQYFYFMFIFIHFFFTKKSGALSLISMLLFIVIYYIINLL